MMLEELVPIEVHGDQQYVSGRSLHYRLGISEQYANWFERIKSYGFSDWNDFLSISLKNPYRGRPATDHLMTMDMAKQVCMLQRSEIGRKFREYFIEVEKKWNDPIAVTERMMEYWHNQTLQLKEENKRLAAKAGVVDTIALCGDEITNSDLQTMLELNTHKLASKLRDWGILCNKKETPEWYARGVRWTSKPTIESKRRGWMNLGYTDKPDENGKCHFYGGKFTPDGVLHVMNLVHLDVMRILNENDGDKEAVKKEWGVQGDYDVFPEWPFADSYTYDSDCGTVEALLEDENPYLKHVQNMFGKENVRVTD